IREPVAVPRIESSNGSEGIWGYQSRALLARNAGHNSSHGIDRGGHPGVCRAQKPAVVFNGTHAGLVQVLGVGTAVTVPSVIGDVDQNLRTLIGALPHFVRKNRFVADKYPNACVTCIERRTRNSMLELAHFFREASGEGEQAGERQVFSEGHEMDFIVA